jgi:hypothetical protein
MPDRSRKRPRDPNQLAKFIVDAATGASEDGDVAPEQRAKNPAAVALGRLGGLKGGKARAANLTANEKRDIARRAAQVRWANKARDDD